MVEEHVPLGDGRELGAGLFHGHIGGEPSPDIQLIALSPLHGRDVVPRVIGYSDDPDSPFKLRVHLSRFGAAVQRISLSDYLKTVGKEDHYVVLDELKFEDKSYAEWYAYAAKAVTVNGTRIPLDRRTSPDSDNTERS